MKDEGEMFLV